MSNVSRKLLCGAIALAFVGSAAAANPDPNRVLITFKEGSRGNAEQAIRAAGGRFHHTFDNLNTFAVTVPAAALNGLRNNPHVELIEQDAPRYAMGQVTPYGVPMVQSPDLVATGADGTGIKVCIIDSGVKADHEDFAGISMTGQSGQAWNTDTCGHGTHVAGTIAAANNSVGVVGVSPGKVSLHFVKVFDGESCAWSYASTLVAAAQNCQQAGAKIISMSLGGGTSSTTERNAFASLDAAGILSIAAAGNDGNSTMSYPASYDSVLSVAAVDNTGAKADFSQYNAAVDISAPGVGILSTYPMRDGSVTVGTTSYMAAAMTGSPTTVRTAAVVDGGLCTAAGSWAGKVVLCQRGTTAFSDKVLAVQNGGGIAAIVYNNVAGGFGGTLNNVVTTIPSVTMSMEDGQEIKASKLGQSTTVSAAHEANVNGYAYLDGTSMATPHVSGVAAIVWSAKPTATNAQVRAALLSTALDLGTAGRDNNTGYGLVQAFDAADALVNVAPPAAAPSALSGTFLGTVKGKKSFRLNWTGGASTVDVFRGTTKVGSAVANTGTYTDSIKVNGSGSYTYKVCNAGTSTCSATVSISYN